MTTDKARIDPETRVLKIGRSGIIATAPPRPRRLSIHERLRTELSRVRKFVGSLIAGSLWTRILCGVLAALTGAVWAFSLARFIFSSGWPALFHLVYAAAAAGFSVVCAVAAFDLSSPDQLGRDVEAQLHKR